MPNHPKARVDGYVYIHQLQAEKVLGRKLNKKECFHHIDENKYNVIDIAILNDTPILSYEGEGIVYNYLESVTNNHSLKFNVVPYKLDVNVEYDYQMSIVDEIKENQIELMKDNMVLLTFNGVQYLDSSEINNIKIILQNINFIKYKAKINSRKNNFSLLFIILLTIFIQKYSRLLQFLLQYFCNYSLILSTLDYLFL